MREQYDYEGPWEVPECPSIVEFDNVLEIDSRFPKNEERDACEEWINTLNEGECIHQAGNVRNSLHLEDYCALFRGYDFCIHGRLYSIWDMIAERLGHLHLCKMFTPDCLAQMLETGVDERDKLLNELNAAKHAVAEAAEEAAVAKVIKSPEDECLAVLK